METIARIQTEKVPACDFLDRCGRPATHLHMYLTESNELVPAFYRCDEHWCPCCLPLDEEVRGYDRTAVLAQEVMP